MSRAVRVRRGPGGDVLRRVGADRESGPLAVADFRSDSGMITRASSARNPSRVGEQGVDVDFLEIQGCSTTSRLNRTRSCSNRAESMEPWTCGVFKAE